MGKQADQKRVREIADYVDHHPGSRPSEIAKDLGVSRATVTRTLPALEGAGRLLAEDNRGRLWPFRR